MLPLLPPPPLSLPPPSPPLPMSPGSTAAIVEATRVAVDFVLSGDVTSFDKAAFATSLRDFFGCFPPACTLQLDVVSASVLARAVLIDMGGTVGAAASRLNGTSAPALSGALGVTLEAAPSVTVETVQVTRLTSAPSPPPPSSPLLPPPQQRPLLVDTRSSVMTDQPRNITERSESIAGVPLIAGTGGIVMLLIFGAGVCLAYRRRRQSTKISADVYIAPSSAEVPEPRNTPISKREYRREEDRNRSDVVPPPSISELHRGEADEAGPSEAELARSPLWRHRQALLAQALIPARGQGRVGPSGKKYLMPIEATDLSSLSAARPPPALPPIGHFHNFVTEAKPALHLSEDTSPVPDAAWIAAKAAARERRRERRTLATPRGGVPAPTWRAPPPLPPDTPR